MRHDDLIYDIGMDQCQDTDFYLAKGFRVVAVDANPAVCEMARERYAKQINSGQLTVLNRAISEASEPLVFHVCETLSMLSTADDYLRDREMSRNGHTFKDVTVEGLRPADLVGEYGIPYFAKIDIEGFDLVCLRGFEGFAEKPYYVSTEADLRAYHD
jgi:FkbM family methyltransferase